MTSEAERLERAGNYVLGLMDETERERAERDLENDQAFRDAVLLLAQRMHVFDRDLPAERVPDTMWAGIAGRIADMPQMRTSGVAQTPSAKPVTVAPARRRFVGRGAQSFGGWRGAAMAASLALAAAIGYTAGVVMLDDPKPIVIVVLDTDAQVPGAIFEAFADSTVRIVPLVDFEVPAGSTLQAWTLFDKNVGPVSLGTFPKAQEVRLGGPDMPTPVPGQLYEITLEPAPGSPTGKPTGPILVKGFATRPAGA